MKNALMVAPVFLLLAMLGYVLVMGASGSSENYAAASETQEIASPSDDTGTLNTESEKSHIAIDIVSLVAYLSLLGIFLLAVSRLC